MEKSIKLILNKAVKLYFENKDWRGYIQQEIKRRRYVGKQISEMFRKWVSLGNENSDD
jgi:hypothetical protein